MEAILRIALSNTLLAAVLALAALAISRTFRRPALSHALWLIVLLKLITPPLLNVALPLMPAEKTHKPPLPPTELSMPAPVVEPQIEVAQAKESDRWGMPTLGRSDPIDGWHGQRYSDARAFSSPEQHGHASTPAHATPYFPPFTTSQWLLIAWTAGSALCILIVAFRIRRFTRLLRFAHPAEPHTQMQARALSSRVSVQNCPKVWLVPGPVCPMLWAFGGKAKLLIPAGLWHRLDDGQRSTLLLHELAHYRRGDHWIRALELLITILFWWNPIAWWARHELREAEEQCCDAWVIWTLPRAARDYAIALMEAIDFVSTTRCAVPVLASPMGEFHDLKRRLLMIKQNAAPRALGWMGFLMICALGALLLPLSATLAQQQERPQVAGLPPVGPAVEEPATPTVEPAPAFVDVATALAEAANDPNAAHREARALVDELQKTSAEIAKLTARLHQAQARLAQLQQATGRANNALPMAEIARAPQPAQINRTARIGRGGGMAPNGVGGGMLVTANNNDQEQRLRTVEEKLDMLIDELRQMRQDKPERTRPQQGQGQLQTR